MKKSKFLKKSLAMLLALMLVVAMIPLSAAAAAPTLGAEAYVTMDGDAQYPLTVDNGAGTITGNISNTAESFTLKLLVTVEDGEVWFGSQDTATDAYVKAEDEGNGVWTIQNEDNTALDVTRYTVGDNVVVNLMVKNGDGQSNYTVTLAKQANSTDTAIEKLTLWAKDTVNDENLPQLGYTVIDAEKKTISITMPYQAKEGNTEIHELELADGASANLEVGDQVWNDDTIEITAGGHTDTYTFKITVASGFQSFETKEGLDAKVFAGDDKIAVLLPWGYTDTNTNPATGKITVTPVFELDYKSATAKWVEGNNATLTSGETSITVNASDVNEAPSFAFTMFEDKGKVNPNLTGTEYPWSTRKANSNQWSDFMRSTSFGADGNEGASILVDYVEGTDRTYEVYFFETAYNNAAEITSLTIGSETATIEGDQINITLPAGTPTTLDQDVDAQKITINGSNNAEIILPMQDVEFDEVDASATARIMNVDFTAAGEEVSVGSPVTIRVTSQDGQNTKDYTLNVTISQNYEKPAITDVSLKNGTTEYEPKLEGKTFVFTVPYSVTDVSDMDNWTFFYSKTVGATATVNDEPMPITGTKLSDYSTDTKSIFPVPGSKETGDSIVVTSVNPATGSEEQDEYKIRIDRAVPSDVSTLKSFSVVGTQDASKVTPEITYTAQKDGKALTVNVPWSAYNVWEYDSTSPRNDYWGLMTETDNENARVYYKWDNQDELIPLKEVAANEANPTGWAPWNETNPDEDTYNGITFFVLSERTWVNLDKAGSGISDWSTKADTLANSKDYTEYTLDIVQKNPETGANLSTPLVLVDSTGWTGSLDVNVQNDTISGAVPYALTSAEGTRENPVYIDYNVSTGAWVLAADNTITDKKANLGVDGNPTASNGDGVFYDAGEFANIRQAKGAYLILERGENNSVVVKLYNGTTELTDVQENKLAVTNEDGANGGKGSYDVYTFNLTYNKPNTEAAFTSFKINNVRGVIDEGKHTITVTLPYGSEFTYLTPVYETSPYATVKLVDEDNVDLISGVTDVNFSTSRQLKVLAEDEEHYQIYTVTVNVSDQFSDVPTDAWYYDNVMGAVANGFMTGKGDGIFDPEGKTTRAQFACALANALGYEAPEEGTEIPSRFTDVNEGDWYLGATTFCYDNGIIMGYEDNTFRPNDVITRQEAAAMLNNAFKPAASADVSDFTDADSIASWAAAHVGAVSNAELMNGNTDGSFNPNGSLTRAELASIMMNALNHGFLD